MDVPAGGWAIGWGFQGDFRDRAPSTAGQSYSLNMDQRSDITHFQQVALIPATQLAQTTQCLLEKQLVLIRIGMAYPE